MILLCAVSLTCCFFLISACPFLMKKLTFLLLVQVLCLPLSAQTDTTQKPTARPDSVKKALVPLPEPPKTTAAPKTAELPKAPKPGKEIIVAVQESKESITGREPGCLKMTLFLDAKTVASEWQDFLKKYDRKVSSPKGAKNTFVSDQAKIPTISYLPLQMSSKVINNGGGSTTVLWAIKQDSAYVTQAGHPSLPVAKELLHDFGVKVYQDDIKDQVKDAEKALSKLENQYGKQVREGQNLARDVENNKKDKVNLLQRLANNRQDSARLTLEVPNKLKDKELAESAFNVRKTQFDSLKASQVLGKGTPDDVKKSQKELNTFEKDANKKGNVYERAVKDTEKNRTEKQTLLKKLADNAIELPKLYSEIEHNKKAQAQAAEAVKKQQAVVETVKERLYLVK